MAEEQVPASDSGELDAKASLLLRSAQRASEAAKRAYASVPESTQARVKQLSDAVLENASKAKVSSKDFLSKVAVKVDRYADKAHKKAGHYAGQAQQKVRSLQTEDHESLGFPLSLLAWCSSLCGSKKSRSSAESRDLMEPEPAGTEFSTEFLSVAAERYAADLEAAADQLEADAAHADAKPSGPISYPDP